MLSIDSNNNITLTRGDTLTLTVELTKDGEPYTPEQGDVIRFALAKGYETENTSWSNNCQSNHLSNVSLTANQKLSVYARGRTGSYYTFAPMLIIIEA